MAKVYYGFEFKDNELKIKKFASRHSRGRRSKLQRNESLNGLFAGYFEHFRKYDDEISSKIIQRHADILDIGFFDFIKKTEILYKEILENSPEKLI